MSPGAAHAAGTPAWAAQGCHSEQQQQQGAPAQAGQGSLQACQHDQLAQHPAQGKNPREGAAAAAELPAAAAPASLAANDGAEAGAIDATAAEAQASAEAGPQMTGLDLPLGWAATAAAATAVAAAAVATAAAVAAAAAAAKPSAPQPGSAPAAVGLGCQKIQDFRLAIGTSFDPVFPSNLQPRQQPPQRAQQQQQRQQARKREQEQQEQPAVARQLQPHLPPSQAAPGTQLLQLPPALLQQIARALPPGCRSTRVAAASACKHLRAAILSSIPALCLRPQQLAQVYACKQPLYSLQSLTVDMRHGRFIGPHVLQNSLLGAAARLPNLRAASLCSISSGKLSMAATLLQLKPLRQLSIAGRGGPLHALPAALYGNSSTSSAAPCFAGITHLTLKRFNLTARPGSRRRPRSSTPPPPLTYAAVVAGATGAAAGSTRSSSSNSIIAAVPSSPLVLLAACLPRLTTLSLQQVAVGPHCLSALQPLAGSLQDLSLCWLHQMRLQLSHLSALTALTALRLAGLALAPMLAADLDDEVAEVAEVAGLAGNNLGGGNMQDGDSDADSDDGEAWEDGQMGDAEQQQQHQQHLSAAQLAQLQAATAAHDEAVAAALAALPSLRCLSASRCGGLSGPLTAGLSELGQLSALAVPLPLRLQELPGCWSGWSQQLTSLQVPELLQTALWQPQRPPLAALKTLVVSGRLAAPDGFLCGFAPNLCTLHAGFICSSKAAAAAAAAAVAAAGAPSTGSSNSSLVGLAALAAGNRLKELAVLDCRPFAGTAAAAAGGNAAALAAAAGHGAAAAAGPAADGAVPAAAGGGLAGLLAAAAQVNVAQLDIAGGLAAVADAAVAAGEQQPRAGAGAGGGGAAAAVPCQADCRALLLRLTGLQRLRLEQVSAGSRVSKQLPMLLCLWSNLAELRLHALPSEFDGAALTAIVRQHGSSLTCLALSSAPGIHWQAVQSLAAASRLRSLSLASLGQVTVASVTNAVSNMPHLTQLQLEGLAASWSSRCSKDCPDLAVHIPEALRICRHWASWTAWRNGEESGEAAPASPAAAAAGAAAAGAAAVPVQPLLYDLWEFNLGEGDRAALMAAAPQLQQLVIIP